MLIIYDKDVAGVPVEEITWISVDLELKRRRRDPSSVNQRPCTKHMGVREACGRETVGRGDGWAPRWMY
ncbi:hypothetical protein [Methanopyrus sp. SNP6]|uniref:hypothetical protein n=1 Tax=Methanopyrus sp. SNP6 TaxID=1937005 RepID=UPI0011E597F3|nr:hypothetical protein [Methanopyrus sp. SNP6]